LLFCHLAALPPAAAQIPPAKPDPLAPRGQPAAGCSADPAASLCEEANPKIIANALGA